MIVVIRLLVCKWMLYVYNLFGLVVGFVFNLIIEDLNNYWNL